MTDDDDKRAASRRLEEQARQAEARARRLALPTDLTDPDWLRSRLRPLDDPRPGDEVLDLEGDTIAAERADLEGGDFTPDPWTDDDDYADPHRDDGLSLEDLPEVSAERLAELRGERLAEDRADERTREPTDAECWAAVAEYEREIFDPIRWRR